MKRREKKKEFGIQWHITAECNTRCKHCYVFQSESFQEEKENELRLIDAKKVVKRYKDFSPFVLWANEPGMTGLFIPFNLKNNLSWEVYTHGGRKPTGIDAVKWAKKMEEYGAGEILLTSMDKDGTKDGYDIELTKAVSEAVTIPVIASGGAGNLEHLYDGLTKGKADAVLAASIFHYKEYTIKEAKEYLKAKGVMVRL